MNYRRLGTSGCWVSEIGLGGNTFGRECDERASSEVVAAALECGINLFDTSDSYSEGRSEELLGRALGSHRDEVVLATKTGWPRGRLEPNAEGLSRRRILAQLEGSLRRLGTDRVDLYYLHHPDPHTPLDESLEALARAVADGKVLYAACSNYPAWEVAALQETARHRGLPAPVVTQSSYSLMDRRLEAELVPACDRYGMGIVAYAPLASSFLTGKFVRGAAPDPARSRAASEEWRRRWLTDRNFDRLDQLTAIAAEAGLPLATLAIGWVAGRPLVSSVLVGAVDGAQVRANVAAGATRLEPEITARLDRATGALDG